MQAEAIKGYASAVRFLSSHTNYETQKRVRYNGDTFNLDRMNLLLKKLGNPHKNFKSVHIAGTKGKGSTATMLAAMLQSCGHKVGLYTSPHINCIRERITINKQKISQKSLTREIVGVARHVENMSDDKPTFFEIMTAMAFSYFCKSNVDIAVIETGLGGRLDSTNVLKPEVCGLTSISMDHMHQLGNCLKDIAAEKAGIMKHDTPTVSVPQHPDARKVLKRQASKVNSKLLFTGDDIEFSYRVESSRERGCHTRLSLTTANSSFEHLPVPVPGEHQAINCGLALALLDQLKQRGIAVDDQQAILGLETVDLPGRMEIICHDPRILVDGAHNGASIQALVRGIGQHVSYDSMVMIVACAGDKDLEGIMRQVATGADKAIFTRASNTPRSADPKELAEIYANMSDGRTGQVAKNLREALQIAETAITSEDLICICGSFYLVGEAKELLKDTTLPIDL